jgi:hypothetical protein
MGDRGISAEDRLAQFSFMSLLNREASWAEISEEIDSGEELESRRLPAPITLRQAFGNCPPFSDMVFR